MLLCLCAAFKEERTKLNFGRCIGIHLAVVLGIDLLLAGMKRGFLSSKRSGGGRGVKKKQHGLDGLTTKGTDHVLNEDINLEHQQSELNKLGNTSSKDHDGINNREAFLDTTKNVKGTGSVNKPRNGGNGNVNGNGNEGLESSSNSLKNLGVNKDGVANVNVTSGIDVHSVMDGHANMHYENVGQTLSNSTFNLNKDVVVPLESIRAISERFVNTTYSYFLEKWVAYFIVANYFSSMDGLDSMLENDDEGKPLENVDYSSDHDSKDEVELVDNEMASFLALKRVGCARFSAAHELQRKYVFTTASTQLLLVVNISAAQG
nr:hypothetical protein [Tanacetum cinerariifolium]